MEEKEWFLLLDQGYSKSHIWGIYIENIDVLSELKTK
jgi:hypothetical protein